MAEGLGVWLRRAREARQLDLGEIERALRIRRKYLQALELGDYTALPGEIQVRGFLRNYARYLGLPVEEALIRYDAEIHGHPVQPREVVVTDASKRMADKTWAPPPPSIADELISARQRNSRRMMRLLIGVLVLFAVIAIASLVWLFFFQPEATPTSTPASAPQGISVTSTPATQAAPSFPVSTDGKVRIRLMPTSSAWISVSADEQVIFQGIARTEQVIEAEASEMVIVATGNGGAFQLFINGTDWGVLGGQGEAVRRAWSPQGETPLGDL